MRAQLRTERGVTLMEVTIMLVATLAIIGVLAPTLSAVVRRAESTAATTAMANIGNQINTMIITDLGGTGGYTYFSVNGTTTGTRVNLLVSDGDIPVQCTAVAAACTAWQALVDNTTGVTDFLERHLVTNNPRGSAANDYPEDEIVPDKYWKGAYLTSPIDSDPWGNRYMVNVQYIGASTNDVVVLSAGPDEEIDTAYTANPITAGGDDLISLVES
jgi:hypothetical protein